MEIAGLVYFIFAVVCAFELSYDAKQRNMSSLWWGIVGFSLAFWMYFVFSG